MTERERNDKFRQIAERSEEWLLLSVAVEDARIPEAAEPQRKLMKRLETDILRIADEIKSADLAEAHRDACEDW